MLATTSSAVCLAESASESTLASRSVLFSWLDVTIDVWDVQLVTNPSLIFLDEPTTGLDSFNAQNVMQTLLELAQSGRTVVATIHQYVFVYASV